MNTGDHIFSPDKKDRTVLTIEIDDKKEDCLELAQKTFDAWSEFLKINNFTLN